MAIVGRPVLITEESEVDWQYVEELNLSRAFGGVIWWNSLYYANFPKLSFCDEEKWQQYGDTEFFQTIAAANGDNKLKDQWVSYGCAREDLCINTKMPKAPISISVEVSQYDGVRETGWSFPLINYLPRRDNHAPFEMQARRHQDNGVVQLGFNAKEFSEKVAPLGSLDSCITVTDCGGAPDTISYFFCLLRINGWPFRVKRLGTYEGKSGHHELKFSIHHFNPDTLWEFLEGPPAMAPTGADGTMEWQPSTSVGQKFYAQLYELDTLGPKRDDAKFFDPFVPVQKGYVWFKVGAASTLASGQKCINIELLEEGIVPGWLDCCYLQAWGPGHPLGYLNAAKSEGPPEGEVEVVRPFTGNEDTRNMRNVIVQNSNGSKIVFEEPLGSRINDVVDLGWALQDTFFQGARLECAPGPGKFVEVVPEQEGVTTYAASGPPTIWHQRLILQEPSTDYRNSRRLMV